MIVDPDIMDQSARALYERGHMNSAHKMSAAADHIRALRRTIRDARDELLSARPHFAKVAEDLTAAINAWGADR